jgi:PAS domain S-box-containing protein
MVLSRDITAQIKGVLEKHPEGLSITDLVRSVKVNRNTAGRYLENLLLSGQAEMRRFGMAKMYTLTKRLPVASVLSISSELVMQLNSSQRVMYVNDPLLAFLGAPAKDLSGKNIEFTPFSIVFEDIFPELLDHFRRGLKGEEWHGELSYPVREKFFFCRVTPTVSGEGTKGVSVLLEDISNRKRDEEKIRQSEERLRSIFKASPVGIGVVSGRILLEVNDRFCQMTGYSPSELVGRSVRMLYPSEEAFDSLGFRIYSQMKRSGTGSIETRWVKKDRRIIDILLSLTPLDPAHISGGITFTALDITERKQAEEMLRESEARLQLALSGSEMGMWEIDLPSMKGSIDERAAAILGMEKSDIGTYRADWDALSHPDDVPLIHQRLVDHIEGRAVIFESEHRMRHTSGRWIWVLGRGKITRSLPDGSCIRVSGTMQDITARKQAEQALRESEDRYRKLIEISPDAVILHQDGKIIYVNPAAVRLADARSSDELTGKTILDIVAPEYRSLVRANINRDLAGEITPPMELRIQRLDKKTIMAEGRGVSTVIDGRPAVLVAINDITERHRAGQALRESENRYRTLAEASRDLIYLVGRDDRVGYVNSYAAAILGLPADEVTGKKRSTLFSGQSEQRQAQGLRRVFETGNAERSEGVMELFGTLRWFDHYLTPITDAEGTVTSVLGVSRDITDRKLADEQRLQREQQYRFISDNSLDIINRQTPDCICTYVSPAVTPVLGYTEEEVLGKSTLAMVHPDDLGRVRQDIMAIMQNGSDHVTSTFRFRHKDGRYLWFESTTKVIRDEKTGQVREFLSISRDITARKEAEDALRASEERYRCLLEQTFDAIIIHKDKKISFLNERAARILGASTPRNLVGRSIFDLIPPESRKELEERIRTMSANPHKPAPMLQKKLCRVDGTSVTVDVVAIQITDNGLPAIKVMFRKIASPEPE